MVSFAHDLFSSHGITIKPVPLSFFRDIRVFRPDWRKTLMGKYLDMAERFLTRRQVERGVAPSSAGEMVDWSALPPDTMTAVKVWSPVLGEAVWVVADDLPRDEWPTDAPVYAHQEVRILMKMGQDTLAWVHAVKAAVDGRVVDGRRRHHTEGEDDEHHQHE